MPRRGARRPLATLAALTLAFGGAASAQAQTVPALATATQTATQVPAVTQPAIAQPIVATPTPTPPLSPEVLAAQRAEYDANKPKSIIELQPFRQTTNATLADGRPVRLISLNPAANAWFLLQIGNDGDATQQSYHIENPDPTNQTLTLTTDATPVLAVTNATDTLRCEPWGDSSTMLSTAQSSGAPFAPICNSRLFLRNHVKGAESSLEKTTDFLRSNIWGGDLVVGFVKDTFFKDAFAETGANVAGATATNPGDTGLEPAQTLHTLVGTESGLGLTGTDHGHMTLGIWYPVTGVSGVFSSASKPDAILDSVFKGPGKTNPLDNVESTSMDYLVAFDLSQFNLGYALGTIHPRLDWSPRPPASSRDASLPGPDGVGTANPLVTIGMVSPALTNRVVAAFIGGFKREHGAFKSGPLSLVNHGSHYGFIEQGVILSKLNPGLSTLYVLDDGTINMKTWTTADDALLPKIRFARQNGVPILETDPTTNLGIPGPLVTQWGPGNWSGSADAQLRTLRAGACLKETATTRFLVYGYFSTATPSAMARTFEAYGCKYAMMLDMNAMEHTYFALYLHHGDQLHFEHMVPGMSLVDAKDANGNRIPRFVTYPDNRDVFYLTRKSTTP